MCVWTTVSVLWRTIFSVFPAGLRGKKQNPAANFEIGGYLQVQGNCNLNRNHIKDLKEFKF